MAAEHPFPFQVRDRQSTPPKSSFPSYEAETQRSPIESSAIPRESTVASFEWRRERDRAGLEGIHTPVLSKVDDVPDQGLFYA